MGKRAGERELEVEGDILSECMWHRGEEEGKSSQCPFDNGADILSRNSLVNVAVWVPQVLLTTT